MLKLSTQKTTINLDSPAGNPVALLAYARALSESLDIELQVGNQLAPGAYQNLVREVDKKLGKYVDLVTANTKLLAECR